MRLQNTKPKVFEEIDNHIADVKAIVAETRDESEYRDSLCDQKIEKL